MRYAIVYFGAPAKIRRSSSCLDAAIAIARAAKAGGCSAARVYECAPFEFPERGGTFFEE